MTSAQRAAGKPGPSRGGRRAAPRRSRRRRASPRRSSARRWPPRRPPTFRRWRRPAPVARSSDRWARAVAFVLALAAAWAALSAAVRGPVGCLVRGPVGGIRGSRGGPVGRGGGPVAAAAARSPASRRPGSQPAPARRREHRRGPRRSRRRPRDRVGPGRGPAGPGRPSSSRVRSSVGLRLAHHGTDVVLGLGVGRDAAVAAHRPRPGVVGGQRERRWSRTGGSGCSGSGPPRRWPTTGRAGSRPGPAAVEGMNCMRPCAPAGETAEALKPDSCDGHRGQQRGVHAVPAGRLGEQVRVGHAGQRGAADAGRAPRRASGRTRRITVGVPTSCTFTDSPCCGAAIILPSPT